MKEQDPTDTEVQETLDAQKEEFARRPPPPPRPPSPLAIN